jgi:large subunit ribosomal protein L25
MTLKLEVTKREGTAAALREAGKMPAVVYGPKQAPISIAVDTVLFTTIITLVGLDEELEVLIHDVAFNAARGGVEHADFYAIERGKELTTHVALEFIGEAPITKGGATVNKTLHEVEVTCRPSALPNHIDVDVSTLVDEDSNIAVRDLVVPAGVKINTDADIIVASVTAARAEEPETVVAAAEPATPAA